MRIGSLRRALNSDLAPDPLQVVLATTSVLAQITRAAHWLVRGKHFMALHNEFNTVYDACAANQDAIAERLRQLGATPVYMLTECLKLSAVQETPIEGLENEDIALKVVSDLRTLTEAMKMTAVVAEEQDDRITAALLDDASTTLIKSLWFLESFLTEG